jgi:type 1 fimbria pilin
MPSNPVLLSGRWVRLFATLMLCSMLISAAYGQGGRASITGVVTDATGSVVPGATVTMRNVGTGLTAAATTTDIGSYLIPLLPTGPMKRW